MYDFFIKRRLKGMKKVTLITGAGGGLGKEFALIYAKNKNDLVLVDVDENGLKETNEYVKKNCIDANIDLFVSDLSNSVGLENVYVHCKDKGYFVNNLVNAAGFGDCCDFKDMAISKQLKMTEVNCNAVLYFTRVFLDDMLKNNEGHIINVSSIAGLVPGPYMCTYHATKSFVAVLGESIAYELRKTNVKVLTLCPGPFNSKFVSKAHNDYTFSKIKPYDAIDVASYGYKKSIKGKTFAIMGFKNKLSCFAPRFFSRKFVTKVSARQLKKGA
ncbi:MAG TPA: hypothetical protein DD377_02790 [Firmicutes bacterium]|nr:hypothetical protein [Bacillota bacterium]HBM70297.1 hypothetical protein [Bacillota bacterium]